jgi:type I restriction enzyme, S subunit
VSLINTVIRPDDTMHGAFVHHLLRSVAFQEEYYRYGKGIVADLWSTNYGEMKAITLAVPPIGEQEAIAAFLDRETGKIDALVAEQERLIALLKEKRQAVISHAVTKGLNPHAPMKDSGIEWLGEIPAHWEATTLRRCCLTVQTGGTPSSVSPAEDIDGVPWFTPGDFKNFRLQDSVKKTTIETVESGECRLFPKGCVLVVSIGATLGKLGVPSGSCSANQQINAIVPRDSLKTDWLAYSLSVMTDFMKFISNASTIGIMNQEKTKEIPIALPPIDEQDRITSYLERQSADFDGLVAEARAAITLLQERRAGLISAAVTGKIDVRGLVDQQELEAA